MTTQIKLTDMFKKVSDNYTVTHCSNGFFIEISGNDEAEEWITKKYVVNTIDALKDVIQDIAAMPRS